MLLSVEVKNKREGEKLTGLTSVSAAFCVDE